MTSTHIALAILFGFGNATSMFLAVRGIPWAWLVVIVSQSLNITYLAVTGQWWVLIGGQPICLVIGIWGLQRWLRKGVHRDPRSGSTPPLESLSELTVRRAGSIGYQYWMTQSGFRAMPWHTFVKTHPAEARQYVETARAVLGSVHTVPPTSDLADLELAEKRG